MSKSSSIPSILHSIQQVVGPCRSGQFVALHEPDFEGTEAWTYVKDCLDTRWVSTAGKWVSRFEDDLASLTGAAHAVAVTNGTAALRLALYLVGVEPNDEVFVPPLSFVATANAVAHLGALPHFVDVESTTLAMDPSALAERLDQVAERRDGQLFNRETGRRLAAVLPVHVFGHPADGMALRRVADAWGLPLVEDAAEALASWRGDTHCGLFGSLGTLSFNGNKLITTGGGGALLTNDAELAHRARHLSTTAKLAHPWAYQHDEVGWNDRLPNLNAALGVAQLEVLESRLEAKRKLAVRYSDVMLSLDGVEIVPEPVGCRSNHWLVTLRFTAVDPADAERQRLQLLEASHAAGLLLRPVWKLLHQLPMYLEASRGPLPVAQDQAQRLVNLPSSPRLLHRVSLMADPL